MNKPIVLILMIILPLVAGCGSKAAVARSTSTPDSTAAQVQVLSGKVEGNRPGAAGSQSITSQGSLAIGGFIQVLENGQAKITLPDGSLLLAGSMTDLELVSMRPGSGGGKLVTRFRMDAGELRIVLAGDSIEVETPVGMAKVSSSIMTVLSNPNGATRAACLDGTCSLENASGSLAIPAGSSGIISAPAAAPALVGPGQWLDPNVSEYNSLIPAKTLVVLQAENTKIAQTQSAPFKPTATSKP